MSGPDQFWPFYHGDELARTAALSTAAFGAYVLLKSYAWPRDGALPGDEAALARIARMAPDEWACVREAVLEHFPSNKDGIRHADLGLHRDRAKKLYAIRKKASDAANAARRAAARRRKLGKNSTVTDTETETVTDTETETVTGLQLEPELESSYEDRSSLREDYSSSAALACAPASDEVHLAFVAYNRTAERVGWPIAQKLDDARKRQLRARLNDVGGIGGWEGAMARAADSDFLAGRGERGDQHRNWRPSIDWFLKPKSILRLMEGTYANRVPNGDKRNGTADRRSKFATELAGIARALGETG